MTAARWASSFIVLACAASGCTATDIAAERERAGKADRDLFGSCAGTDCSGASEGNCYCDDACADVGDCCADKYEVCDAEPRGFAVSAGERHPVCY
jgi:hypothetical protein